MSVSLLEFWLAASDVSDDSPDRTRSAADNDFVPKPNDDTLVTRVRAGDEAAFAELVGTYSARLFGFAYRELGTWHDAEEIVQDVLVNVWERRAQWTVTHNVTTYLFQAVRHRISNVRRSRRVVQRVEQQLSAPEMPMAPTTVAAPDAALDEQDLRAALDQAMAALPERPRQVFHLSREQHLTFREIAIVLGLSVRTVESHMARAVAALRHELADWIR